MKKIYKEKAKRVFLSLLMVCISLMGMATTYYVSNTGSDSNSGLTTALPWQTLGKVNATTLKAGDQILFQKGSIFYGSLTINQSGVSGNPITFGAYGTGTNPIITGFTTVTAWTNKGNNIWESTNAVSTLSSCNMVTIGGVNTAMGRYPKADAANSGYLTFQSHSLYTSITSSDLTGTPNWTGAEVAIRSNAYKIDRSVITSQSGGTLNYSSILNNPQDGSGFFIQGDIRCCTQQNDWYYNTSTKKISIYSTSQPANVNVASVGKLVTIQGNYLTFTNLTFTGANDCALFASGGTYNNLTVTYCSFSNVGISSMYTYANYVDVENCSFTDSNNNSISTDAGSNITIRNNTFQNIGLLKGMKDLRTYPLANSNVEAMQTSNYIFENNNVTNVGYDGINFYGSNVLVKNNFFNNFCAILNDGGAIYTYTGGRAPMQNVLITGNICINSPVTGDGTSYPLTSPGIYLDYASANVEISYNSIANTYRYGLYISSGGNVNTHHNTVYNGGEYQLFYMINDAATLSNTDQVKYNTFVSKLKDPDNEPGNYWGFQKCLVYVAYTANPDADIKTAASNLDYNCYARPIADDKVVFISISGAFDGTLKTIADWKTWSGQDLHSYGSPQAITDVNDLQFVYNETSVAKTVTLSQPMIDMNSVKYAGSIVLQPYTGVVLMKDYNPSNPQVGTDITTFTLPGQIGSSVINATSKTIGVTVPYGTSVTSLAASFTLSTGATVKVGTTAQISGTTANNFASPVVYVVTAQDGVTAKNWTVTVTVGSNTQSEVTAFTLPGQTGSSVINSTSKTIGVTVPYGTSVTSLAASFTLSTGATVKVGTTAQVSGTTANNFASPVVYVVTAQDGVTTKSWTVTVTVGSNTQSEVTAFTLPGQTGSSVINSSSKTIGITMPYGTSVTSLAASFTLSTGATVKVGTAAQVSGTTANNFASPVVYVVTAQDGVTTKNWTVTVTVGSNTQSDVTAFTLPGQTGSSVINATSKTIGITMPYGISVTSLAASFTLSTGATVKVGTTAQVSGTTANNFASPVVYVVTAQDGVTTKNWTVTVTVGSNTQSDVTAFTLPGQTGSSVINATSKTIGITMPYGTSVTSLAASFTLSTGATVKVGTAAQVSGTTANNFASPVVYVVTAQDGVTTKSWTVTVTVGSNTQSDVTAFTLPGQTGSSVINSTSKTIGITMPYGTSVTSLAANFALSTGATVKVGTAAQVSGSTANNFASPVVYVVTAQDGVTTKSWTVTVTVGSNTQSEVTAFTLPGQTGSSVINSSSKTIGITMPYGTSVTSLAANFALSTGATVKVGTTAQVSGSTVNSFASPVVYTVTAQDGVTIVNWTVTVTVGSNNQTDVTAFTLPGQTGSSVINSSSKTIGITMPYGTSVTSLAASFTLSTGATAVVSSFTQISGTTMNSFATPVTYMVIAQDGVTTMNWTVTVDIAPATSPTESVQIIDLKTGWNTISFNVLPANTDFKVIFQSLIQSGVLVKIQDEKGRFMVNTAYGWYSNLPALDAQNGYNVKVNTNAQLIVKGQPVSVANDITLNKGFNILGNPMTKAHEALSCFQSLISGGSLIKVQDETGKSIVKRGGNWISSIDSIRPGKGYYVTVNQNTSINFSSLKSQKVATVNDATQGDTYFQTSFQGNPYSSMNFVIRNLSKSNLKLQVGDEIGIFDGSACVGNFIYDGMDIIGLSAGMEDQASLFSGFTPGDTIKFQIWRSNDRVLVKNITAIFLNSPFTFASLGTAIAELQVQMVTLDPVIKKEVLEIRNYPNPFVEYTTFEFSLNENTNVSLEIYDMVGKKVKEIVNQNYDAGINTATWDGTNQNGQKVSPGIYIYYYKAGNYTSSKKIIFGNF